VSRSAGSRRGEDDPLREQIEYYRLRAVEYDDWYDRRGRYDRGEDHRAAWRAELEVLEGTLLSLAPFGSALELACGTGHWTVLIAPGATHVTAVDAAPEALAIARELVPAALVDFVLADAFAWQPRRRYDFIFFGFWLSHVPEERFDAFWKLVADALAPNGRVFFADSLYTADSSAVDHRPNRSGAVERRLNDGREFRVVKVFYEAAPLERRLRALGWHGTIGITGRFFLHGLMRRRAGAS
jgi:demethylmenaquinone methyltransferase/2-methoxy-6-polyprenyl-1,4-benzoquinol methylase